MHSKNFYKFRGYYNSGLWDLNRLWNVVGKPGGIRQDEYREITGLVYPAKA